HEESRWRELKLMLHGRLDETAPEQPMPEAPPAEPTVDPSTWLSDSATETQAAAGASTGFDFNAQAHWAEDGTYYPPGYDPYTGVWLAPEYEQAYAQGYVWDASIQNWVSLQPAEGDAAQGQGHAYDAHQLTAQDAADAAAALADAAYQPSPAETPIEPGGELDFSDVSPFKH